MNTTMQQIPSGLIQAKQQILRIEYAEGDKSRKGLHPRDETNPQRDASSRRNQSGRMKYNTATNPGGIEYD